MSITDLHQFVQDHAERGTCRCGKCIDHPGDDRQPKGHTVDMVFFEVCIKGNPDTDRLRELISVSKKGEFCDIDMFDNKEHSYIEVGAWIGDQGLALMLMGIGAVLGLWEIMTPKMIPGLSDELVKQMAGQGLLATKVI